MSSHRFGINLFFGSFYHQPKSGSKLQKKSTILSHEFDQFVRIFSDFLFSFLKNNFLFTFERIKTE